jgi:hypothetical protein
MGRNSALDLHERLVKELARGRLKDDIE